jgi:hypothetical protein
MPGPTRGCRAWGPVPEASSTTSNDELARNPHAPVGFRRRAGICGAGPHARQPRVGPGVAAPRQCALALPASRRLAAADTARGTRPML